MFDKTLEKYREKKEREKSEHQRQQESMGTAREEGGRILRETVFPTLFQAADSLREAGHEAEAQDLSESQPGPRATLTVKPFTPEVPGVHEARESGIVFYQDRWNMRSEATVCPRGTGADELKCNTPLSECSREWVENVLEEFVDKVLDVN